MGGVICPLLKMNQWDIYIYGGGKHIEALLLYLYNLGIEVKGILDCDIHKEGTYVLDKYRYFYPYHVTQKYNSDKTFVIINTIYFKGIEQYEIVKLLLELGITKFYELSEADKNEIRAKVQWTDIGRIKYYREHFEELKKFYMQLYDQKSQEIMLEFIRVYMEFGTYALKQCNSNMKYFYGQNVDGIREELYQHLENEVWINCGSNIGDNIFWYFANGLHAKNIYAYESDKEIFERLVKNLKYLPEKYRNLVHPINEFIDDKTNWEMIKSEPITLINADIEGGELELLKSMKNIICMCRPVLALCAYHKADDLVELPKYIQSIVGDYCFILRKYEANVENVRRSAELVLYAIPKERISNEIVTT